MTRSLAPYYVARGLGSLGNEFQQFAVPLLTYKATGSVAWSGLAFFVEWVPRLLSFPVSGVLVDRFGARRMYMVADGARCLSAMVAVMLLVAAPQSTLPTIMLVGMLGGFSFELAFLAVEKAVRENVPASRMHRVQAVLAGVDHAMMLAGPALAGTLAMLCSTVATIGAMAVLFAWSMGVFLWMTWGEAGTGQQEHVRIRELRDGLRLVAQTPRLLRIVLLTTLTNAMVGLSLALAPAMTTGIFGKADGHVGTLYTAAGAAGLVAVALTPRLAVYVRLARLGILAFLATCAAFFAVSLAPTFPVYVAATATLMAMDGVFTVFIRSERAFLIPEAVFGKTLGIVVLLNFLPMPFVGLTTAAVGESIGARGLAAGSAIACLCLSIPLLVRLWEDRRRL